MNVLGQVTAKTAGSCTITAEQPGSDGFLAASTSITLAVERAPSSVSISPQKFPWNSTNRYELEVATSPPGLPIESSVVSQSSNGTCTVSGRTMQWIGSIIASCTVRVRAAATTSYESSAFQEAEISLTFAQVRLNLDAAPLNFPATAAGTEQTVALVVTDAAGIASAMSFRAESPCSGEAQQDTSGPWRFTISVTLPVASAGRSATCNITLYPAPSDRITYAPGLGGNRTLTFTVGA